MLTCKRGSGGFSTRGKVTGRKISTCLTIGTTTDPDDGDTCSGRYESGSGTLVDVRGSGTLVNGLTVRALVTERCGNELCSFARFAA